MLPDCICEAKLINLIFFRKFLLLENAVGPGWFELDWKEEEDGAEGEKDAFFDFDDETSAGAFTPQQRRAAGGALKGSARKKTTRWAD